MDLEVSFEQILIIFVPQASGALFFVCAIGGWYILCAQMLESTNMPFQLPVGDLSHLLKRKSSAKSEEHTA